jgi:hypothetical protein
MVFRNGYPTTPIRERINSSMGILTIQLASQPIAIRPAAYRQKNVGTSLRELRFLALPILGKGL